jgi:RNA polymerase sigma-70 factor (ECF subfamily)
VDTDQHQQAVAAFTKAATEGDVAALVKVLDPAVVLTSDGGGKVRAARNQVHGPDRVARFLVGIGSQLDADDRIIPVTVNGEPGFALIGRTGTRVVCALTIHNGLVNRVDFVVAPDKLPDLKPS